MIGLSDSLLKYLLITSSVIMTGVIFYFSWVPDPNIGNLVILHDHWFSDWINEYGNLRTAIPFFVFALFFEFLYPWNSLKSRIILIVVSLIIVFIAETGQLLLPNRHFDLMDIVFGLSGTALGLLTGILIKSLLRPSARHFG